MNRHKNFLTAAAFVLISSVMPSAHGASPILPEVSAEETANSGGTCYGWVSKIYAEYDENGKFISFTGVGWEWEEVDCSYYFPETPHTWPNGDELGGGGGDVSCRYEVIFPEPYNSPLNGDFFVPPQTSNGGHLNWATPAGAKHDREWVVLDSNNTIKDAVCSFLGIPNVDSDPVPMVAFSGTMSSPWWLTGRKDLTMTNFQYKRLLSGALPPSDYWSGYLIRITGVSEAKGLGGFPH
jgi:hypothetical protein